MTIHPALAHLQAAAQPLGRTSAAGAAEGKEGDFGGMLVKALEEVNGAQGNVKSMQQDFLSGRRDVDVHDVMIAQEKASTAMQLTMAVRNKALEAFQEINRLPV